MHGAPSADPWQGEGPTRTPGVWNWFVVYCVVMALVYLACIGVGVAFLLASPNELDMEPVEALIIGWSFVIMGGGLLVAYAIGPLLPRRRWVWVYDLVLICFGMTSCCTLPVSIPLLIFWIRPELRRLFEWD